MKKLVSIVVLSIVCVGSAVAGDAFVQGFYGMGWYQSDHNSNHDRSGRGLEFGYNFEDIPLTILGGYLYTENSDSGMTQRVGTSKYTSINYDYEHHNFTVWAMPRIDFGRFTFAAGPGIGTIYDTVDLDSPHYGESDSSSGWQDNYSLRADLHYAVTDNVSVGFTYRHDYFEVELDDREVSDYEVNQDAVWYLGSVRWTF